ncbi:MAG TPA: hypothetical protein VII92_16135 [Anaerolineae bacterium]
MLRRLFNIGPTVITSVVGVITFITFLLPSAAGWRMPLVQIAVVIAGVAVLMGFIRLISVHVERIRRRKGIFYSFVLILSALVTLGVVLFLRETADTILFNGVIVPMQSALGALLAVFLALAAFRMLRRRRTFGSFCFLLSALVVLITQVPIDVPALTTVRQFVDALTTGGMRGLLLGVAIGIVATAFRVLLFIDRPQSE